MPIHHPLDKMFTKFVEIVQPSFKVNTQEWQSTPFLTSAKWWCEKVLKTQEEAFISHIHTHTPVKSMHYSNDELPTRHPNRDENKKMVQFFIPNEHLRVVFKVGQTPFIRLGCIARGKPLLLTNWGMVRCVPLPLSGADLRALRGEPWGEAVGVRGRDGVPGEGPQPPLALGGWDLAFRAGSRKTPAELWMRVCSDRTSSRSVSLVVRTSKLDRILTAKKSVLNFIKRTLNVETLKLRRLSPQTC